MKRIIACLMAGILMLALVGCGTSGSSSAAAKKDYTQILHDARSDEDNEYLMIFTKGEDGKFTAQYGYSAEYEADQLSDEVANMMMPLLGLEDGMYDDFAASVSGMMVSVYGVAIVKPAEGRTQDVVDAMDAYVQSQQKAMERYLEDQYEIAKTYDLTYVAIPNTETTLDVHPTIKGHAYIANKLVNAIENP